MKEKMIRCAVIGTQGAPSLATIPNTLDGIRKAIGCETMESLYVSIGNASNFYLLFDEEGKMGFQDTITCALLGRDGAIADVILGNCLVVRFDGEEDFQSLSLDDYALVCECVRPRADLVCSTPGRLKVADRFLVASAPNQLPFDLR